MTDRSQGQKRADGEIATAPLSSTGTVWDERLRFEKGGLGAALYDKPRPGAQPKFTGEVEARLTVLACSDPPAGHGRWTLRLLADRMMELGYVEYISHVTVRELRGKRTWPWRVKSCIGQPSARCVAKIEDVLDVYRRLYDAKRPVVCVAVSGTAYTRCGDTNARGNRLGRGAQPGASQDCLAVHHQRRMH